MMQGRSVELDIIYSKVSQGSGDGNSKSATVALSASPGSISGGGISAVQGQAVLLYFHN